MQTFKIFVVGGFNAGKTSFIRAVSEIDVVSTEAAGTNEKAPTVAFDFGRLTISDDLVLYFFANPGARSAINILDEFRETLLKPPVAYILIVDSRLSGSIWHDSDAENRDLLKAIQQHNQPYIVVLSRQDMSCARTPEEIRFALGIPEDIPMISHDTYFQRGNGKIALLELFKRYPDPVEQIKAALQQQINTPQHAIAFMMVSYGYASFLQLYSYDHRVMVWSFNGSPVLLRCFRYIVNDHLCIYFLTPGGILEKEDVDYNRLANPRFVEGLSQFLEEQGTQVAAPIPYLMVITDEESLQKARGRLEQLRASAIPYRIALEYSKPEADLSLEHVREVLALAADFTLYLYQRHDQQSKHDVLLKLLDSLPSNPSIEEAKAAL